MKSENNNILKNKNLNELHFSAYDVFLTKSMTKNEIIRFVQQLKEKNVDIYDAQAFRVDSALSEKHISSAVWHAWNGFKNNLTISGSLSIEFLLYLSGQRQISKALQFFGLGETVKSFSLMIFNEKIISKENLLSMTLLKNNISMISPLNLSDSVDKRKNLAKIFDFASKENLEVLDSHEGYIKLENYILTSISNLVFETSKLKIVENK